MINLPINIPILFFRDDIPQCHAHGHSEKRKNLLRFLVFMPFFMGIGYCINISPLLEAKTSKCMVVSGVIKSSGNVNDQEFASWWFFHMLL